MLRRALWLCIPPYPGMSTQIAIRFLSYLVEPRSEANRVMQPNTTNSTTERNLLLPNTTVIGRIRTLQTCPTCPSSTEESFRDFSPLSPTSTSFGFGSIVR